LVGACRPLPPFLRFFATSPWLSGELYASCGPHRPELSLRHVSRAHPRARRRPRGNARKSYRPRTTKAAASGQPDAAAFLVQRAQPSAACASVSTLTRSSRPAGRHWIIGSAPDSSTNVTTRPSSMMSTTAYGPTRLRLVPPERLAV